MSFIDYLENIYQTEDIYRAIILITNDNDDSNNNTNANKIQNLIKTI